MPEEISQERSPLTSSRSSATAPRKSPRSLRGFYIALFRASIIVGFLLLWQIASGPWIEPFLISSPTRIFSSLIAGFTDG